MQLLGTSLIGKQNATSKGEAFYGVRAATGERLEPVYFSSDAKEVDEAARLAELAFRSYRSSTGAVRGGFLRLIAEKLESVGDELIGRAQLESGLPEARLRGELGRTTGQLRLFASVVEEGSWVSARIDTPLPDRKPVPRPDLRSMLRPLGPVAVFGASNFPLAFSVAGGDTASALAAGCPVIVKAHPAHPGTSEIVGNAIRDAVREAGLPEGIFSLLLDAGFEVGKELVLHPAIKAVGFTGSTAGGKALMQYAGSRAVPIPVYAEMGSVNPLVILPGAMSKSATALAEGLYASFTLGAGQFCTKPGLTFIPHVPESEIFIADLICRVQEGSTHPMLTPGLASRYASACEGRMAGHEDKLERLAQSKAVDSLPTIAVYRTKLQTLIQEPHFAEEVFGPSILLVDYDSEAELLAFFETMEGQLTATVHATSDEISGAQPLLSTLEQKVGRLLINGFPTGVEVSHAMVHGGPFPATSDGRSTSVGTQAILRFARPVCFQNFPDSALAPELRDANPLGIERLIDGSFTRDAVTKS